MKINDNTMFYITCSVISFISFLFGLANALEAELLYLIVLFALASVSVIYQIQNGNKNKDY